MSNSEVSFVIYKSIINCSMELVSIIIPVYNTEYYISRCLTSVVHQTYSKIEIIVVNDASEDNSLQKIQTFLERDNRIRLINLSENKGNGAGRNIAIKMAKGDYLYFVDSDDYIEPKAIENLIDKANKSKSEVIVVGHVEHCYSNVLHRKKLLKKVPAISNSLSKDFLFRQFLLQTYGFQIPPWKYFVKRELVINNKILFDESKYYFEDIIFAAKLVYYANKIESSPDVLYNYVLRKNSIMGSYSSKFIESKFYAIATLRDFLKQENIFDLYREEYSMFFLIEGFLASCTCYTKMDKRNKDVEDFLFAISKSSFIQHFDVSLIKSIDKNKENDVAHIRSMIKMLQKQFYGYIALMRFTERLKRRLSR